MCDDGMAEKNYAFQKSNLDLLDEGVCSPMRSHDFNSYLRGAHFVGGIIHEESFDPHEHVTEPSG